MVMYYWSQQTNTWAPTQTVAAVPAVLTTATPVAQTVVFPPYFSFFPPSAVDFYQPISPPAPRPAPQLAPRPVLIRPVPRVKFHIVFYGGQGPTFWSRDFEEAYPQPPTRGEILMTLSTLARNLGSQKPVYAGQAKIWVAGRRSSGLQIDTVTGPIPPEPLIRTIELAQNPTSEDFFMQMAEIRDSHLGAFITVNWNTNAQFERFHQRCADTSDPNPPTGNHSNNSRDYRNSNNRDNSNPCSSNPRNVVGGSNEGPSLHKEGSRAPSPEQPQGDSSSGRGRSPKRMRQASDDPDNVGDPSLPPFPESADRKGKSCMRQRLLPMPSPQEDDDEEPRSQQQGDLRNVSGVKWSSDVNQNDSEGETGGDADDEGA